MSLVEDDQVIGRSGLVGLTYPLLTYVARMQLRQMDCHMMPRRTPCNLLLGEITV